MSVIVSVKEFWIWLREKEGSECTKTGKKK